MSLSIARVDEIAANDVVEGDTDVDIQAAIDNLTSGRTSKEKVVLLGDFTVAATITVPSYTVIEVYGSLTCTDDITNAGMLLSSGTTDVEIIGGLWDVDNTTGTRDRYGISMSGVTRFSIRNVRAINSGTHCIQALGCNDFYMGDNNCGNAGDDGISILYCYNFRLEANHVDGGANNGQGGGSSGIEIEDGSHDGTLVGNIVDGILDGSGSGIHMVVDPEGTAGVYNISLTGNETKNCVGRGLGIINLKADDVISAVSTNGSEATLTSVGHKMTNDSTWKIIIDTVVSATGDISGIEGEHIATYVNDDTITIPFTGTGTGTANINYANNTITVTGHIADDCDESGLSISNSEGISVTGGSINRCGITGIAPGMILDNVRRSQLIAGSINRSGQYTISAFQCGDLNIIGNTASNGGQSSSSAYAIYANQCTNTKIDNNNCFDDQTTKTMEGIRSLAGGTNQITNNFCDDVKAESGSKLLYTEGDLVENNTGFDSKSKGYATAGTNTVDLGFIDIRIANTSTTVACVIADSKDHIGLFSARCTNTVTGGQEHTLTLTSGTFDGTNNVVTFNANGDAIYCMFDGSGGGALAIPLVGTAALS